MQVACIRFAQFIIPLNAAVTNKVFSQLVTLLTNANSIHICHYDIANIGLWFHLYAHAMTNHCHAIIYNAVNAKAAVPQAAFTEMAQVAVQCSLVL